MAKIERFEDIESRENRENSQSRFTKLHQLANSSATLVLRINLERQRFSILLNIAEGFERGGDQEFLQFLAVAKGSCGEVRAQLYVALDQGYLPRDRFESLTALTKEISRMISGFMQYLRQSSLRGNKYR